MKTRLTKLSSVLALLVLSSFSLQTSTACAQSTNLVLGVWSGVTNAPTIIGSSNSVTLLLDSTSRFFRLHEP